jgi:methionyl-tRNA formyltransferase
MTKNLYKILFFGRKNDKYSLACISFLESLGFDVFKVWSERRGGKLPSGLYDLECDFIMCFRSHFILPKSILNIPKFFSINFHPGPPEYPGTGCVNFSLYEDKNDYGVTIHIMNEKVDDGKIIDVFRFPVLKSDNLKIVLNKTHKLLFNSFCAFNKKLIKFGHPYLEKRIKINKDIKWSGIKRKQKDMEAFQKVEVDIDKKELERRIRSFNYPGFPVELELHGYKFVLDGHLK